MMSAFGMLNSQNNMNTSIILSYYSFEEKKALHPDEFCSI